MTLKTKPYKYQGKGVAKLHRKKGRLLLADEMGLGKTLQALIYADEVPEARPIIVVCPAHLKYNWEREAMTHINMRADVLEGQKPRKLIPKNPAMMYIINYEILRFWVRWLRKLNPQIVMIDECQYIQNRHAIRTKATRRLCRKVPKVIAMSGTPLTNRPAELWATLNILRPDLFPEFFTYGHRYCGPKKQRWGWEFKGATRLPELHKILKTECMIRRKKKDVLKQLPKHSNHIELLPLTKSGMKEYKFALKDFIGWLKTVTSDKGRIKKATRVEALAKIGYISRLVARLKMGPVIDWIKSALDNSDGKWILFARHKIIIKALEEAFPNITTKIDGSVVKRKRQYAIDQFTRNKTKRIMLGQLKAASTGWNGTAASNAAFIELGDVPADHTQASARMDRIGQTSQTQSYYLIAKDTLEEKKCAMLQKKQGTVDSVLDGTGQSDGLNIHDLLISELLKEG